MLFLTFTLVVHFSLMSGLVLVTVWLLHTVSTRVLHWGLISVLKVVSQSSCRDRPPANSCLLGEPPANSCLLPERLLWGTDFGASFSERSLARIFFIADDSKIKIHYEH